MPAPPRIISKVEFGTGILGFLIIGYNTWSILFSIDQTPIGIAFFLAIAIIAGIMFKDMIERNIRWRDEQGKMRNP